jgi:hypothetical protein
LARIQLEIGDFTLTDKSLDLADTLIKVIQADSSERYWKYKFKAMHIKAKQLVRSSYLQNAKDHIE